MCVEHYGLISRCPVILFDSIKQTETKPAWWELGIEMHS